MRLYLSGKISGNENYKKDFASAKAKLENAGYDTCDPTSFDFPEDVPWAEAMKYDIKKMLHCDGVALLSNWQESKGACIEARLAIDLGMTTMPITAWLKGEGMRPHDPSGS
ncbi:MAG: DUF4406 domain-containing protein [Treponema sp.]|nr:DUF4406 domain-containing protein [Treponema sp.]